VNLEAESLRFRSRLAHSLFSHRVAVYGLRANAKEWYSQEAFQESGDFSQTTGPEEEVTTSLATGESRCEKGINLCSSCAGFVAHFFC
jgi:hypothetical protein